MSDDNDDLPDDLPEEIKAMLRRMRANGSKVGVIPLGKDGGLGGISELLKTLGARYKLGSKPAEFVSPDSCLVLNSSAEFDGGTGPSTRDANKLVPMLMAKIPLPEGTRQVAIEFEDAEVLLALFGALHRMVIGHAFMDREEVKAEVATKVIERDAIVAGKKAGWSDDQLN